MNVFMLLILQAHYSTGKVAASFTSTSVPVETIHEAAVLDDDVVRYSLVKKKGKNFFESNDLKIFYYFCIFLRTTNS